MSKLTVNKVDIVSRNFSQKVREVPRSTFDGNNYVEFEVAERSEKIQMLISFEGIETFNLTEIEIARLVIDKLI